MSAVGPWLRSVFYVPSRERTYHRNLSAILGWDALWGVGTAVIAPPIINALLLQLTDSRTIIGLVYLAHVASLPALLPAALLNQNLKARRKFLAGMHTVIGLTYVLIGVATWQFWQQPSLTIALVFALLAIAWLAFGAVIAPAFELMGILFGRHYGTVSGLQFFVNRITGVVGGLIATWMLAAWAWPANFTLVFITGGLVMVAANACVLLVREPEAAAPATLLSLPDYVRTLIDKVARHQDFVRLLIVATLLGLFQSVLNFYSVYAFDVVALPVAAAGALAAAGFIASAFGALAGGRIGDALGHRFLMRAALVIYIVSLVLLLPSSQPTFYASWILGNAALIVMVIGRINLTMDLAPPGEKGSYTMVVHFFVQPVLGLTAVCGGIVIDLAGYMPLFLATLALAVLALVIIGTVKDPRLAPDFG